MTIGLETLDLARIHEQALVTLVLPGYSPGTRAAMVRRAGTFFAEAITPIEKTHRTAREANVRLDQMNETLRQRTVDLAASNRQLKQEIAQRKAVEEALRKSERHYGQLLEQSRHMQEQLRHLSRQLLSAQEEERKKISRELHDVIAQTLTGINVRLAALKKEAALNTKGLERNIARTQRLVEKSVDIVHRFARELRPTVLDDLGLIPALHSFMKDFRAETGIRVSLTAFAAVEQVNGDKRTVLYRVAQEALTNVARHAQASRVEVKHPETGRRRLHENKRRRQMLSGGTRVARQGEQTPGTARHERTVGDGRRQFRRRIRPGKGTTILAQIPLANGRAVKDSKMNFADSDQNEK